MESSDRAEKADLNAGIVVARSEYAGVPSACTGSLNPQRISVRLRKSPEACMATATQVKSKSIPPRSSANDLRSDPSIPKSPNANGSVSNWHSGVAPARPGLFSRMKRVATAPIRGAAKRLIRHLGRKYRFHLMYGFLLSQYVTPVIYVAARLRIAELLREGPKTVPELAALTGANEINLNRVMRALATLQIFRRSTEGRYEITSLGETLLQDSSQSIRDWVMVYGEVMLPTLPRFSDSVIGGQKAFDNAFGMPLWEYFSRNEEMGVTFDRAMSDYTDRLLPGIVEACDLASSKTILDIGGGRGALITALLNANPHLQGVLYDRPEVTEESQRRIEAVGLTARCRTVSGSFLESIPTSADTYVIKHVLHDWDDTGVRTIFRNCRNAMQTGDRLLILEMLTEHPEFLRDSACKWYDFVQMCGPGGRLRTVNEFESLLTECGLSLCKVTPTKLWDVVILEATLAATSEGDHSRNA